MTTTTTPHTESTTSNYYALVDGECYGPYDTHKEALKARRRFNSKKYKKYKKKLDERNIKKTGTNT